MRENIFNRNTRFEKHVPRPPKSDFPAQPQLGSATPSLTSIDASGSSGPTNATGAGPGGLGGSGSFGLQAAETLLSSAQILALLGTPVTLVPAPNPGFRHILFGGKILFLAGTVAYTDVGGAVQFTIGATSLFALASNAIFLVTVSPNKRTQFFVNTGDTDTAGNPSDSDGQPLQIKKITNNFAAGNGTAKVTVYYLIEPTT